MPGLLTLAVLLSDCRCGEKVEGADANLSVSVARLDFPATYLGSATRLTLSLVNTGRAPATVEASVAAPFATGEASVRVEGGAAREVSVDFTPTATGPAQGTLKLGPFQVAVRGEGLAVPECPAALPCQSVAFQPAAGLCVAQPLTDGASCSTACIVGGACRSGACVGALKDCGDGDTCTLDACGDGQCSHLPVECPAATAPCHVAACDRATGCGEVEVPDGTLCGPDLCTAALVDICLSGQCVQRPRPKTAQCTNTWVPLGIPGRAGHALAYDAARQRTVLFWLDQTWEWDGSRWLFRTPVGVPPKRLGHSLAYDAVRKRVVLFGGYDGSQVYGDTWEWDGTTWVERSTPLSPPARSEAALAWDVGRKRLVLFGGSSPTVGYHSDTWEWDGARWLERTPAVAPAGRAAPAMAYDGAAQRVLLFGGVNSDVTGALDDTWEFDGLTWVQRFPSPRPSARWHHALAWDSARQRVLLFGGEDRQAAVLPSETWEWSGLSHTWVARSVANPPQARASPALAFDAARGQVLLFGGADRARVPLGDTWAWDGTGWRMPAAPAPSARWMSGLALDPARQRLVLFGGYSLNGLALSDTWEFDGALWAERHPQASPFPGSVDAVDDGSGVLFVGAGNGTLSSVELWRWDGASWAQRLVASAPSWRAGAGAAWDSARQRLVLFGGYGGTGVGSDETWESDGTSWSKRAPPVAPAPRRQAVLTYDAARQRVLLFGGLDAASSAPLGDTWEWDGAVWVQRAPAASPSPRFGHRLAYDSTRQRVLLFGGTTVPDTWEWDGTTWLERMPAVSPPGASWPGLAFDGAHVVLYGNLSDTWVFLP